MAIGGFISGGISAPTHKRVIKAPKMPTPVAPSIPKKQQPIETKITVTNVVAKKPKKK